MHNSSPSFLEFIKDRYEVLFRQKWPWWSGGAVVGFINVVMFSFARPWSVADGIRNWGDFLLNPLLKGEALAPWLYSTSLLNFSFLLGALASALLSKEFSVRWPPFRELIKGFIGGIFMGTGATLSMGCTIGGFLSAVSALSMAGFGMMVGLTLGTFLGLKYLLWEMERVPLRLSASPALASNPGPKPSRRSWKPFFAFFPIACIFAVSLFYDRLGMGERGGLFLFGALLGVVNQRSRFCVVRAFREPFMTGRTEMTKAVLLALTIGTLGFTALKWSGLRPYETFVYPCFWLGSITGGILFGFGMVVAGGCASGSLWRAGEGHVKMWACLATFIFSSSLVRELLMRKDLFSRLGEALFIPDLMGWKVSLVFVFAVFLSIYLLVSANEIKGIYRAI